MPVLLLLFLTPACVQASWPPPAEALAQPWLAVGLAWLGVLLEVLFAAVLSLRIRQRLRSSGQRRDDVLQRYLRGRRLHTVGLFLTYGLALYVFGYGWAVPQLWRRAGVVLPGAELLLLAPFFASLVLSWACFYSAEKAFWFDSAPDTARPFFTRWAFVWFHLRQNLALVFLPIVMMIGFKEFRRVFPDLSDSWQGQVFIEGAITVTIFVTLPWIIRLVLGLEPMPPGPLRDRLEAAARRLRFRCNDLLVWNMRSGMANAMVVGVCPFLRYVLFTDRLLEELTPEEVEVVFGHEVGHVKHQHMLYYLFFLLMSLPALGLLLQPYLTQLEAQFQLSERSDLAELPSVIVAGLYIFPVFGFLSRRCERQADIYGCRVVSCGAANCEGHNSDQSLPPAPQVPCATGVNAFIGALEKVAIINGISRDKPGFLQRWLHSTIARRVTFLQQMLTDPRVERRFQQRVFLLKCGLFAVLGIILLTQFI